METNGRHVTDSDGYWLGRLAMAVAVAPRYPDTAREALEDFIRSARPSQELTKMLREELKHGRARTR